MDRNAPCWCGSGLKYKKCHLPIVEKIVYYESKGCIVPGRDLIKTVPEIAGIRESAKLNTKVLDAVAAEIREGMSTMEINEIVNEVTYAGGGIPAPLNYEGFPKSVCTSVNDVICHGIPSEHEILKNGDIINVDVSTILNGYFSDASRMFLIGDVPDNARKLVQVTEECVKLGLEQARPWNFIGDIGCAVNRHAAENGYSVVRDIGGHGVGLEFHEEPFVPFIGEPGTDMLLVPGMTFTIEPMINEGTHKHTTDRNNGWTVRTKDHKLSAQIEYMILITEDGAEILTK